MPKLTVSLKLSSDEFLKYYKGRANTVIAYSYDGKRVKFPASILKPFVTHNGIDGIFILEYDNKGKLSNIIKKG